MMVAGLRAIAGHMTTLRQESPRNRLEEGDHDVRKPEPKRDAQQVVAFAAAVKASVKPWKACNASPSTCAIRASCVTRSTRSAPMSANAQSKGLVTALLRCRGPRAQSAAAAENST
jgi:hypothetical protein